MNQLNRVLRFRTPSLPLTFFKISINNVFMDSLWDFDVTFCLPHLIKTFHHSLTLFLESELREIGVLKEEKINHYATMYKPPRPQTSSDLSVTLD